MTIPKPYLFAILAAILLLWLLLSIRSCDREKDAANHSIPAKTIRTEQRQILNADSLNSATQAKIRLAVDSTVKAMTIRQQNERKQYASKRTKDQQAENDYATGKVPCDSVILAKNSTIKAGETLLARCDSLRTQDSVKIGSYAAELEGKNVAIKQLSGTIDKAVKGLDELGADLAKEKGKRFGLGVSAGYGATKHGISPQISVSVNYNLIKF